MNRVALQSEYNAVERVLYMAMELSDKHWKLVFSDGGEKRVYRYDMNDIVAVTDTCIRPR